MITTRIVEFLKVKAFFAIRQKVGILFVAALGLSSQKQRKNDRASSEDSNSVNACTGADTTH